jgi:hypothetical protein
MRNMKIDPIQSCDDDSEDELKSAESSTSDEAGSTVLMPILV